MSDQDNVDWQAKRESHDDYLSKYLNEWDWSRFDLSKALDCVKDMANTTQSLPESTTNVLQIIQNWIGIDWLVDVAEQLAKESSFFPFMLKAMGTVFAGKIDTWSKWNSESNENWEKQEEIPEIRKIIDEYGEKIDNTQIEQEKQKLQQEMYKKIFEILMKGSDFKAMMDKKIEAARIEKKTDHPEVSDDREPWEEDKQKMIDNVFDEMAKDKKGKNLYILEIEKIKYESWGNLEKLMESFKTRPKDHERKELNWKNIKDADYEEIKKSIENDKDYYDAMVEWGLRDIMFQAGGLDTKSIKDWNTICKGVTEKIVNFETSLCDKLQTLDDKSDEKIKENITECYNTLVTEIKKIKLPENQIKKY